MSHHTLKLRLIQRLRELGMRLEDIESELEEPHSRDWDEMAVEREGEEVLETLGAAGKAEVARIRAALGRMKTGEYGYCQACGEEIPSSRLEAVPDAPLCLACAKAAS